MIDDDRTGDVCNATQMRNVFAPRSIRSSSQVLAIAIVPCIFWARPGFPLPKIAFLSQSRATSMEVQVSTPHMQETIQPLIPANCSRFLEF